MKYKHIKLNNTVFKPCVLFQNAISLYKITKQKKLYKKMIQISQSQYTPG